MNDITISFVDDQGTLLTDVFPDAPMTLAEDELTDKGNYVENISKLNFGSAQRDVTIEAMIMTTGPGFFKNCPECKFRDGGVYVSQGHDLVVDPGGLEIERQLL